MFSLFLVLYHCAGVTWFVQADFGLAGGYVFYPKTDILSHKLTEASYAWALHPAYHEIQKDTTEEYNNLSIPKHGYFSFLIIVFCRKCCRSFFPPLQPFSHLHLTIFSFPEDKSTAERGTQSFLSVKGKEPSCK